MKIKQKANCSITLPRFDTGENITFTQNSVVEVDEDTGNFLKAMRCKTVNDEGVEINAADFEEVVE